GERKAKQANGRGPRHFRTHRQSASRASDGENEGRIGGTTGEHLLPGSVLHRKASGCRTEVVRSLITFDGPGISSQEDSKVPFPDDEVANTQVLIPRVSGQTACFDGQILSEQTP